MTNTVTFAGGKAQQCSGAVGDQSLNHSHTRNDSESDLVGAEEVLEESPCKRWSKRGEQVNQRDVPGIDFAYLAMDNDTGNEVVWNEMLFSQRKDLRAEEERINAVFEKLTHLVHQNLVKFHMYWTDTKSEKPRVIFISEYMSSGSLSRFLQRTRKSGSPLSLKAWKKWTVQVLSALSYLHSCDPPIVHANLTCDTIFIQHNALIKIGCVAPSAIHHHVKTFRQNVKNLHYIAPEYQYSTSVAPSADIYSFGICALEMASPVSLGGVVGSASSEVLNTVSADVILKAIHAIQDPMQKNFVMSCLNPDPLDRPNARDLLFHTVLFEVHSLKLLAAHRVVASRLDQSLSVGEHLRVVDHGRVVATSKLSQMTFSQVPAFQKDLEKFLEDVTNGIFPLTAFAPLAHQPKMTTSASFSTLASDVLTDMCGRSEPTPSPPKASPQKHCETRSIVASMVTIDDSLMTIKLRLDDSMIRQLTTQITDGETASELAAELVHDGLISVNDEKKMTGELEKALLRERTNRESSAGENVGQSKSVTFSQEATILT